MLTIGKVARGQSPKEYYLDLREESYYDQKGKAPGEWNGELCATLGLEVGKAVAKEDFSKLLDGQSPTSDEQLRQRRPNERPAFDLTFSAPKSVSVVHALADQETKQAIEAAMYEAVREGLRYIESDACYTRLVRLCQMNSGAHWFVERA
ncbi:MAG TPA: relaxase domain-containing protein [Candidatus Methylomirabilis sp.]|nr:relaxase domain-containing protein [Candidatus Methylomirabilis sp.]